VEQSSEKLFNRIAPFYGLFFGFQVKYYQRVLEMVRTQYNLLQYKSIIDVGCGTGALCYVLASGGMKVTGVDSAAKMLAIAAKKLIDKDVDLIEASVLKSIPFPDKSFDVAISSYTVHGMKEPERRKMYEEMGRLARHQVIFHDYNEQRALITDIAERLEGGDYFSFIKVAETEMEQSFKEVRILNVNKKAAWYICTP
jgi:ubiquinone/menaquinone biosynthesis C-methylase UbiE